MTRVLFRDDRVLVIDKPAGVSMATSTREEKSEARVLSALLAACGLGAERDLDTARLVHRLDVGTSGVVLLALAVESHRTCSLAFQERRAQKSYRALCWGHPVPARGRLEGALARDPVDGRRMRVHADGKPAATRYETLRRFPSVADLRLSPETGRTHQIRVHLAHRGHPIVGDDLYGGATRWHGVRLPAPRQALSRVTRPLLHAERLVVEELSLDVSAPLPVDYVTVLSSFASVSSRP